MCKWLEQTFFFQRRHTNGLQVSEEMINTTKFQGNANQNLMRYHLTPLRTTITKKSKDHECWQGLEKTEPLCTVGGNVNVQSLQKKSLGVPQKFKNRTTVWFSNLPSECVSKENKIIIWKRYLSSIVHHSIIHIICPQTGKSIKKMWCVYNEISQT